MKDIIFIKTNKYWKEDHIPLVSVITSNFNRREILLRCMRSVDAQTFRDIDYIVVDNGSTVCTDDIVEGFMEEATIPVMFIKRSNGIGRQTGRNSAIRAARGTYLSMIDSDDEYLPSAMELLVNAWNSIPIKKREKYREVVGLCQNEYGKLIGIPFPEEINTLSKKAAQKVCLQPLLSCEHANMSRTILLKENLFPEPEGVSSYTDSVIWWKLAKNYRSFFINDVLKVYYIDSTDSITNDNKKGIQISACIGSLWSNKYYLNHWDEFAFSFRVRLRNMAFYLIYSNILRDNNVYPANKWAKEPLNGVINHVLCFLMWLPCKFLTKRLLKKNNNTIIF